MNPKNERRISRYCSIQINRWQLYSLLIGQRTEWPAIKFGRMATIGRSENSAGLFPWAMDAIGSRCHIGDVGVYVATSR